MNNVPFSLGTLIAQAAAPAATTAADPAAAAPAGQSFMGMGGVYLLLMVGFYFLFIRPQSKARKEQQKLVDNLKSGDEVVTSSGILGTVTNVKDRTVLVRIAEGVKIEILKSAVTTVVKADGVVSTTPA
jgi:preprotein translocase subunit YajC